MPKPARIWDALALIFSFVVIAICGVWLVRSGAFSASLVADQTLSWHLVRSAGLTAYILLTASMIWGMLVSTGYIRNWSPGALSTTLHNTASAVAFGLGLVHALLLMLDGYYHYSLADLFVPFIGPYRPEAVGLGTLAFWLLVAITISFPLKRYMGHRRWKLLHMTSYLAYGLVTLHGLFAGTDSGLLGFRLLLGASVMVVVALVGVRMVGRWRAA